MHEAEKIRSTCLSGRDDPTAEHDSGQGGRYTAGFGDSVYHFGRRHLYRYSRNYVNTQYQWSDGCHRR